MIAFIKDIRKEYEVSKMPFVIGVLGTGVTSEKVGENKVSLAQRKAAQAPEFKGNVLAVESYKDYSLFSNEVYKSGWAKHFHEWSLLVVIALIIISEVVVFLFGLGTLLQGPWLK